MSKFMLINWATKMKQERFLNAQITTAGVCGCVHTHTHTKICRVLYQRNLVHYLKLCYKENSRLRQQTTLMVKSIKHLVIQMLDKFFQKIKEATHPNSFYETGITLIRDVARKGNYGTFLMNINIKIFQKILANQIQKYIKRIICFEFYLERGLSRNAKLV